MKRHSLLCALTLLSLLPVKLWAQDSAPYPDPVPQEPPSLYSFVPNAVMDIPLFLKDIDPREHWRDYLWLGALTGALIAVDQPLIDESQRFAKRIGLIGPDDTGRNTRVVAKTKLFGIDAPLHVPESPNAYFYYIGDGATSLSIVAGLTAYGALNKENRALYTASQLMESMLLTGFFGVLVKTSTGRESPYVATKDGGEWRPFPGYMNYLRNPPRYDAYPSGHLATVMSTVRVLAENYKEKTWIRPAGYTAMGLLGFGMLNNGVHWASDYPVGIAIGYVAAGVTVRRYRALAEEKKVTEQRMLGWRWQGLSPEYGPYGAMLQSHWVY